MERRFYLRGLGLGIAVTALIMGIIMSRDSGMSDKEIIARAKELGMVENTVLSGDNGDAPEETDMPEAGGAKTDASENENASSAENESGAGNSVGAEAAVPDGDENEAENSPGTNTVGEETDAGKTEATDRTSNGSGNQEAGLEANDSDKAGVKSPETTQEDENGPDSGAESEESARDLITSAAVKTITVNSGDGSHTVAKKLADVGVVISAEAFDEFLCQNGYDKKLRTGTFSIPADASDEQIARIVTGAE